MIINHRIQVVNQPGVVVKWSWSYINQESTFYDCPPLSTPESVFIYDLRNRPNDAGNALTTVDTSGKAMETPQTGLDLSNYYQGFKPRYLPPSIWLTPALLLLPR